MLGTLIALAVAGPLAALPGSFIGGADTFDQIAGTLLPEALVTSLGLAVGVYYAMGAVGSPAMAAEIRRESVRSVQSGKRWWMASDIR